MENRWCLVWNKKVICISIVFELICEVFSINKSAPKSKKGVILLLIFKGTLFVCFYGLRTMAKQIILNCFIAQWKTKGFARPPCKTAFSNKPHRLEVFFG